MIFNVERWHREWDTEEGCARDYWENIGIHEITIDSSLGMVHIGYRDSGFHVFLQNMFEFQMNPHAIEIKAFSGKKEKEREYWHLRLTKA